MHEFNQTQYMVLSQAYLSRITLRSSSGEYFLPQCLTSHWMLKYFPTLPSIEVVPSVALSTSSWPSPCLCQQGEPKTFTTEAYSRSLLEPRPSCFYNCSAFTQIGLIQFGMQWHCFTACAREFWKSLLKFQVKVPLIFQIHQEESSQLWEEAAYRQMSSQTEQLPSQEETRGLKQDWF